MRAMTFRLEEAEYERLRTLAFVEKRSMTDGGREAIEGYVRAKAEQAEFRAALQRALAENARVIADLAGY